MITEIIEYIRGIATANGINTTYAYEIQTDTETNACCVRTIGASQRINISCGSNYQTQIFNILYRGTEDRATSVDIIESVEKALNDTNDITLANTQIIYITGQGVQYAFTDSQGYIHYSVTMQVTYT